MPQCDDPAPRGAQSPPSPRAGNLGQWAWEVSVQDASIWRPDSSQDSSGFLRIPKRRQDSHAGLRKTVAGIEIDLSALAKGYAVDQLVELLKKAGGAGGVVEIGGEIRTWGRRKDGQCWQIGIEKPLAGERTLAHIIRLEEAALATSGDYRNFRSLEGKQLCHLIDPHTGTPLPAREMSVSVCAKTCIESDALATALFLMGKEKGLSWSESRGVAAMFLTVENGKLTEKYSSHFEAYLR